MVWEPQQNTSDSMPTRTAGQQRLVGIKVSLAIRQVKSVGIRRRTSVWLPSSANSRPLCARDAGSTDSGTLHDVTPEDTRCSASATIAVYSTPSAQKKFDTVVEVVFTHSSTTVVSIRYARPAAIYSAAIGATASALMTDSASFVKFLSAAPSSSRVVCSKSAAASSPSSRAKVRTQP